jgi:phosphoribosylpyrophosphate synthetase
VYKRQLDLVVGTDSTYHSKEFIKSAPWFKEVTIANYFAEAISRVNQRKSITGLFD